MKESPSSQSTLNSVCETPPSSRGSRGSGVFDDFVEFISDAVVTFDLLGRIHFLNLSAQSLFGFSFSEYEGKPLRQIFPLLTDRELCGANSDLLRKTSISCGGSLRAIGTNGRELNLLLVAARVIDNSCCQLLLRDISPANAYREDLLHLREINQAALQNIADGVITTNTLGEIESLNPVARQLLGLSLHAGRGVPVDEVMTLIDEQSQLPLPSLVEGVLRRGRGIQVEANVQLHTSEQQDAVAVSIQATPIRNGQNQLSGCVLVIRSINEASRASSHLNWQANHDLLTQLPNRHYFEAELSKAVAAAQLGKVCHGLIYVDLFQFKLINDTCGYTAGDELLRQLAELYGKKMRSQDLLARLGSDEFGILLRNCTLAGTQRVADILLREMQGFRFHWNDQCFKVGVSVGALMLDKTIESEAQALSAAHASCCAAKEAGRNRIHLYHNDSAMVRRRSEMNWVVKINEALTDNRLVLYRQAVKPITALNSLQATVVDSDSLPHFEVLVRLSSSEGKLISPAEFIPAAERYGLMDEVDRWVLKNLLGYLRQRQENALPEESYAVNLSGASLGDEGFCEFVWSELAESGVPPRLLHFEITETAAVSNLEKAVEFMELFGEKGCKFYLDDFGSGLSSFAYLKDFPVHFLKIDGSFVKGLEVDSTSFAMVSTINHLAHVMGIKTVAEYVENIALLEPLRKIGVDYAQGYGIERPIEIAMGQKVVGKKVS